MHSFQYHTNSTTFLPTGSGQVLKDELNSRIKTLALECLSSLSKNHSLVARGISFMDSSKRFFMCVVLSEHHYVNLNYLSTKEDVSRVYRPSDFSMAELELTHLSDLSEIEDALKITFRSLPVLNLIGFDPYPDDYNKPPF